MPVTFSVELENRIVANIEISKASPDSRVRAGQGGPDFGSDQLTVKIVRAYGGCLGTRSR